jgi:hypothetical protein
MSTKTRAERADVEPREPRCRICRRSDVRRLVNDLLGWRGVPVILEGGNKRRRITYTDILGSWSPSTRVVTRGTGSPMTASGSTPSVTTTLPG